jgi:5-methylcytosine-specific restriction protein A
MSVFLLTWNPTRWIIDANEWDQGLKTIAAGGVTEGSWSIGSRTSGVHPGDVVLLVRVAKDRGIVASGRAASVAHKDLHWDPVRAANNELANFVTVEWDAQVEIADRLPTEELLQEFPEVPWNNLMGSGVRVVDEVADQLVRYWFDHVGIEPDNFPDEVATYIEGGTKSVLVNRYERNPAARRACLDAFGSVCAVCGFNGEENFGEAGAGLIHVHHKIEISQVGREYEVDPLRDLVPVCPNCHAMIHRRRPAYSIEEVQRILGNPKSSR